MPARKRDHAQTVGAPPVAVVTLSDRERQIVARRHPELGGYASAVVVVAGAEVSEEVASAIELLRESLNDGAKAQLEALITEYLAAEPATLTRQEAVRQATFRRRIIAEHGGYTAVELADRNGSKAANRYRLASGWRSTNRIFAVEFRDRTIYLAFQFDDGGRPLPVIERILSHLPRWSDWDIAAWFVRPNGLLDNMQPVELLESAPERVVTAASLDGRHGISPLRRTHHTRALA